MYVDGLKHEVLRGNVDDKKKEEKKRNFSFSFSSSFFDYRFLSTKHNRILFQFQIACEL